MISCSNNIHSSIFTLQFITPRWIIFAGRFHKLSSYSIFICPLETMYSVGGIQLPQEKMCLTNWHRQGLVCREGWISLAWHWSGFYWHRRFVSACKHMFLRSAGGAVTDLLIPSLGLCRPAPPAQEWFTMGLSLLGTAYFRELVTCLIMRISAFYLYSAFPHPTFMNL